MTIEQVDRYFGGRVTFRRPLTAGTTVQLYSAESSWGMVAEGTIEVIDQSTVRIVENYPTRLTRGGKNGSRVLHGKEINRANIDVASLRDDEYEPDKALHSRTFEFREERPNRVTTRNIVR